jgi:Ca-activated chloride channel homolog
VTAPASCQAAPVVGTQRAISEVVDRGAPVSLLSFTRLRNVERHRCGFLFSFPGVKAPGTKKETFMKSSLAFHILCITLLLAACTSTVAEQENLTIVRGIVTDQGGQPVAGAAVGIAQTSHAVVTDAAGRFELNEVPAGRHLLEVHQGGRRTLQRRLVAGEEPVELTLVIPSQLAIEQHDMRRAMRDRAEGIVAAAAASPAPGGFAYHLRSQGRSPYDLMNRESYASIHESGFIEALNERLSTFSIDVDRASYSNIRRFVRDRQMPPADAVRIEEMLNYFTYDYPDPTGAEPFSVTTEVSAAPWHRSHRLLRIGIQGKRLAPWEMKPNNLVFLIDVSGSMESPLRLPLVKSSLRLLVEQLRPVDQVSIVVYAGAAGVVLPPTPGSSKDLILDALENLKAGGSTAGGAGIQLAYSLARENFIAGGNNRVILATDGDFNVGVRRHDELESLITEQRQHGVFLTVLGYGMGNYQDSRLELLANKGNGNYAYIDSQLEAEKVLVQEIGGTLQTIAKDVKIQVEFDPVRVASYRLIGYENRRLNEEDFADDSKDAGELGAGHSVTALYEIVPAAGGTKGAFATLNLRYKQPAGETSRLTTTIIEDQGRSFEAASADFRFAAAVAKLGMLLRDSEYKGTSSLEEVAAIARITRGPDADGTRGELLRIVESLREMERPVARRIAMPE